MRKAILVLVMIMLIFTLAQANNANRIKDLQAQQQAIAQQIDQAQKLIQQKQFELMKIQGAIEILQKLDEEEKGNSIENKDVKTKN